jgi:hypothetical protein
MNRLVKLFLHLCAFTCAVLGAVVFMAWYTGHIDIVSCVAAELVLLTGMYGSVEVLKEF